MARGWESKQVEAQQADQEGASPVARSMTPEEQDCAVRRRGLELARARTVVELERATRPAHRAMLTAALADVERVLAALDGPRIDPSR